VRLGRLLMIVAVLLSIGCDDPDRIGPIDQDTVGVPGLLIPWS
jgi:hypothetical protein